MDRALFREAMVKYFGGVLVVGALLFLPAGSFRYAVCNPPYYPVGSGYVPEDEALAVARTELRCTLEDACAAAAWLLQTGGSLWMVHRPERLTDLLCGLRAHDLEPKILKPVCAAPGAAPSLILVKATKGGKPGLVWQAARAAGGR